MNASYRPLGEYLLLVLALSIVGIIVVPLWQQFGGLESREELARKWSSARLTHLFLGPEQTACYVCAVWAGLILLRRRIEVWRQRQAFAMDLLSSQDKDRILPEDCRLLLRKLEQVTRGQPYILGNMIRLGLRKYSDSRSESDVAEVVRSQAEVEMSRLSASISLVHYLAWAIPAIGFVGTVRGLGGAFGVAAIAFRDTPRATDTAPSSDAANYNLQFDLANFISQATDQMTIAFDCTLIALILSLLLMFLLHTVQRAEETLVADAQEYCNEHLLLRLYKPLATSASTSRP